MTKELTALGGGPLLGDRWVYGLYLDESGIGKIAHGPLLVVAGVLIHADTQWRPIGEYLNGILDDATPVGAPRPSCLHAKDIYYGGGEFPKSIWPEAVRLRMLDQLAQVPWLFGIPIMWGGADRAKHAETHTDSTPQQQLIDCYTIAAFACFVQAEWYMRNRTEKNDLTSITLEKNNDLQKRVLEVFHYGKSDMAVLSIKERRAAKDLLPLTRIIDSPNFQDKTSSSILQMADFCAWAFQRAAAKGRDYERFGMPLARTALIWNTSSKGAPISAPFKGRPRVFGT